ncbi:MAG TPA: DUF423 domain-containing protein [Salinarimonas sp.]|nr:DUF423 domain-containing protein [Salinarimonas sp.]
MKVPDRALVALAGLAGLLGVALSAAAAHVTGGGSLDIAARFLLIHGAALLALTALIRAGAVHGPLGRAGAWLLVAGLCLFCGDLTMRAWRGVALFPFAAPAGGFALMGGWLLAGASGLAARR